MFKRGVKIALLLLWLFMMGWWWYESRYFPAPEKVEAAFLPDYLDHYRLTYGEQPIGWAYKSMRRLPEIGYQGGEGLTIQVRLGGEDLEIKSTVVANFDRVMNLLDFQYMVQAGPLTVIERGLIKEDGRLELTVNLGRYEDLYAALLRDYGDLLGGYAGQLDFSRPVTLDPPLGPGLRNFIPSYLSYLGLMKGSSYSLTTVDPVSRRLQPTNVRVEEEGRELDLELGRDMPAFRVRLSDAAPDSQLWVDRYGRTVREEGLGFKLTRVDEEYKAKADVTPFTPPKSFERLLNNDKLRELIDRAGERAAQSSPTAGQDEE